MFFSSILPESFNFSGNTFSWFFFFCLIFYFTLTLDFQLLSSCHCHIALSINLTWCGVCWPLHPHISPLFSNSLLSPSIHMLYVPVSLNEFVFTMPLIMLFSVLRNSFSPSSLDEVLLILQNSPLLGSSLTTTYPALFNVSLSFGLAD